MLSICNVMSIRLGQMAFSFGIRRTVFGEHGVNETPKKKVASLRPFSFHTSQMSNVNEIDSISKKLTTIHSTDIIETTLTLILFTKNVSSPQTKILCLEGQMMVEQHQRTFASQKIGDIRNKIMTNLRRQLIARQPTQLQQPTLHQTIPLTSKSKPDRGIEPRTFWLRIRCSKPLS